jgi:hypothetical protein
VILKDNLAYASGTTVYKFSEGSLAVTDFIEKDRAPLQASIHPNPIKDKVNLSVTFNESDHVIIELYDSVGHLIKQLYKDDIATASSKTYTFDFPYASGVYIINLHTNTGRQSIKFVK